MSLLAVCLQYRYRFTSINLNAIYAEPPINVCSVGGFYILGSKFKETRYSIIRLHLIFLK